MLHAAALYADRRGENIVHHARPLEPLIDLDVTMKDADARLGAINFLDRRVTDEPS
jgi:hypothetical protein